MLKLPTPPPRKNAELVKPYAKTSEAMIMTAFPPIDALDGIKPEYHTMPGRGEGVVDEGFVWHEQLLVKEGFEKGSMRVVSFVQRFVCARLYKRCCKADNTGFARVSPGCKSVGGFSET